MRPSERNIWARCGSRPKPTQLTRPDRWRAKVGKSFYFVTFDVGHHETYYTRLFSSRRGLDLFVHMREPWIVETGRVTFKKTFHGPGDWR